MKRLLMLIPLVFMFCLGCQQGEKTGIEADIQAIKDAVADINDAINTGDIDKASFYHADRVVIIPPNRTALVGKETCVSNLEQAFDQFTYQEVDIVEDVQVSGNLAVTHYTWTCDTTPKSGGETFNENGNGIFVFKKQPDGAWKFVYLIYSNERLISPDGAE